MLESYNNNLLAIGITSVCILFVVYVIIENFYLNRIALKSLIKWTKRHGHVVIDHKLRSTLLSPFLASYKWHRTFHITVRTMEGDLKKGWVRVGGGFFKWWDTEEVKVIWDK
jgi:hypothetical protein